MLLIGSRALIHNNPQLAETRKPVDWDIIATIDQFTAWHKANKHKLKFAVPTQGGKYYHCQDKEGVHYEFEIAWPGTSAELFLVAYSDGETWNSEYGYDIAVNNDLYLIKMSHRFKKNSPHFNKTMNDIKFLRQEVGMENLDYWMEMHQDLFNLREKESYTYSHPKLNVSSKEFFSGDGVDYIYEHDSIHLTVALTRIGELGKSSLIPAYTFYMKDGSEVMTSKEKFFAASDKIRLYGVYEEVCVLALERSQIPYGLGKDGGPTPRQSFMMALEKVCTSITSGWFRQWAWEAYDEVVDLYEKLGEGDYVKRFLANQHLLIPYKG